ncbi:MAG: hypothetical protein AAFY54_01970 [Cyanobacteria bacterium J06648_10]
MARDVDLISVDFDFNGVTFRINGAKYFYDDADIRANIGADETDENDFGGKEIITKKVQWKRRLIPLTAIMKGDIPGGDAAQSKTTSYFNFYCRPDKVGEAFDDLPGKAIDASLLPGDFEIKEVIVRGSGKC